MEAIREKRNTNFDRKNPQDFFEVYLSQDDELDERMFTSK